MLRRKNADKLLRDPRRGRIYKRLGKIGEGPAAFYLDACRILDAETELSSKVVRERSDLPSDVQSPPMRLSTAAHLVGHLFRDIESAIRQVLVPAEARIDKDHKHRDQIDAILKAYELNRDESLARAWHRLRGQGESSLHKHAHRNNLGPPRTLDDGSRNYFSDVEAVFDVILNRFEERYFEMLELVNTLIEKHPPTKTDLKVLRNRVPNNRVTLSYFFSQATDPAWLDLLASKGYFKSPPVPSPDEEEDAAAMQPWPAGQYLVRMAAVPELEERVAEIALQVPPTQNFRVHECIVDVTLAIPVPLALQFLDRATTWCRNPYFSRMADRIGRLIERFLGAGELGAALHFAAALFDPDNRSSANLESGHEAWEYEQTLLKLAPELIDAGGMDALEILTSCLVKLLRGTEGATFWRPAIERNDQNQFLGRDARQALVTAVRDGAEALCTGSSRQITTIVRYFEAAGSPILDRIALHLLRVAPDVPLDLVTTRLLDRTRLNNHSIWHEYTLLAWSRLDDLAREEKALIVQWAVEDEKQLAAEASLSKKDGVEEPKTRDRDARAAEFRALSRFRCVLPDKYLTRYERLEREFGKMEHPEFLSYHGRVLTGPTSPMTAKEMEALSVEEIIAYLRDWTPENGLMSPTRGGLARELSNLVAAEPDRFAAAASLFLELDPSYVRGLVGGLSGAARNRRGFDWKSVIVLCAWVVEQNALTESGHRSIEPDDEWAGARSEIPHLLMAGFQNEEQELPFDLRSQAWAIVECLASDPDPTREYEAEFVRSSGSAYDRAINTTRGSAVEAAVKYGLWVRRNLGEPIPDFDSMPEVRFLLKAHLEPSVDPSLAVRSIYGRWLPWIHFLDPEWTAAQISQIFPSELALRDLREAAWDAYILYCRPYDEMLPVLRDQYRHAVSQLGPKESEPRRLEEGLAEHLVVFYLRGHFGLQDELLVGMFERANESVRRHMLAYVGRALANGDNLEAPVKERATALWESRAASLDAESMTFGWWFAASALDSEWRLVQLEQVLARDPTVEADHSVFEEFVLLVERQPVRVLACVRRMIEVASDVKLFSWRKELRQILERALRSENPDAVQATRDIVGILVARGEIEYRSLLDASS